MSRHAKGVLAGAAISMVVGAAAIWLYGRSEAPRLTSSPARAPGGFVTAEAEKTPAPPSAPPLDQQIDGVMQAWRVAILGRDADMVMTCDRAFLTDARTFTPALVKSAQSDPDDRVRAFSTRVLGKLGDPALIEVFLELLHDGNPFVRENAAWSLGELQERASGVGDDLEKVRRRDKAEVVRRAAMEALKKVRGGSGAHRRAG